MHRLAISLAAAALAAATAGSPALGGQSQYPNQPQSSDQQPTPNQPQTQPAPPPAPRTLDFEALIDRQTLDAAFGRKTVATAGLRWTCEPPRGQDPVRCRATGAPTRFSVAACRQLARRVGPVEAFRGGNRVLSGTELERCNGGLQHAAGLPQPGEGGFVPIDDEDAPPPMGSVVELPADAGPALPPPSFPAPLPVGCAGPDPAIVKLTIWLDYGVDGIENQVMARAHINDGLMNIGRSDFVSGRDQARVHLTKVPAGTSTPEIHPWVSFGLETLPAGAVDDRFGGWYGLTDGVFRVGDSSTEFPTQPLGLGFRIVYDPDIFIDGNPQNDDCNLGNNELFVTSDQIRTWAEEGRHVVAITRGGRVTFHPAPFES